MVTSSFDFSNAAWPRAETQATLNKLRALVNDRQKFKKQTAPSSTDPNDPAVISYKKSAADWDKKLAEAGLSVTVLDGILGGSSNENQAAFDMQVMS